MDHPLHPQNTSEQRVNACFNGMIMEGLLCKLRCLWGGGVIKTSETWDYKA